MVDYEGDVGTARSNLNDQPLMDMDLDTQSAHLKDSTKEPPIFKLIAEIFEHILLLNATDPDVYTPKRAATTMASSQVCTKWRSAALNYPMIWGHIIFYRKHSLRWINQLLRRSEPSLLDFGSRLQPISIKDRQDGELGVLELVLNNMPRLRIFSLQATTACWELLQTRFLQQPAPNLEFMHLCILLNPGHVLTDSINLYNDHAPSLRNVHLYRCAVDLTSPVLTPLTELYVREITALNAAPTVKSWLHVLGEMSSLRWLTIMDAISSASNDGTILPSIHLAKLEMLRVDGVFHESVTLINQLVTPPHCGLRVDCRHTSLGPDQRILCAIIERKLKFWEKDIPDRRFIAEHEEYSVALGNLENIDVTWGACSAEVVQHSQKFPPWPRSDPVLTIILRLGNTEDVTPLFLSLFALFDHTFATTTYLSLWIDCEVDNDTEVFLPLVNSFRSFVNLKSLDLLHDFHSYLFPLLQHVSPSNSVLLPTLHTVHFLQADFWRSSGSLACVTAFLRWRREEGFPVQKVRIYESRVDREFVLLELGDVEVDMADWNDSDPDSDDA